MAEGRQCTYIVSIMPDAIEKPGVIVTGANIARVASNKLTVREVAKGKQAEAFSWTGPNFYVNTILKLACSNLLAKYLPANRRQRSCQAWGG